MDARPVERKPWAVLAYTVADDKGTGDSLDAAAKEELKSLCNAADFGQMNVAAQVDFKHTRGVFRGVLTEPPPKTRGFESIPADSHPLWRGIKAKLDRAKLRVLKERRRPERVAGQRAQQLPALRPAGVPGRSLRGLLLRARLRPAGPLLRRRRRRRLGEEPDGVDDACRTARPVAERAAVIVFRACQASTLETAYQLRDAGEFMLASQSIVPIAGIWPWDAFLASAEAGSRRRATWRSTSREQLALFLETPANREPFADVPYSLIDLGAADAIVEPLKALADALDAARPDAARR